MTEITMNGVQELLRSGDFFAAVEQIQSAGTSSEIAARYVSLVSEFYWKAKDLPAVVAVGRAGILYCLTQSQGATVKEAERLRSVAKGLAYDVGSFTWPGWEEPEINPTPADLIAGAECSRLNLRLAIELKKPVDRVSMAHWLVGAHLLAAHKADQAGKQFQLAVDVLPEGEFHALRLFSQGCVALARLCRVANDSAARADFEVVIVKLTEQGDEDAKSYLAQLRSSQRLLVTANR